jgi:hypothetical protein
MPEKLSTEYVKDFLKERGYTLLTNEYENAKQKLKVVCENGHVREVTFSRVGYKTQRCSLCVADESKLSIEYVKQVFENDGYTLTSKKYGGARKKLHVKCPEGHAWFVSLNKFKDQGQRCPQCSFSGGNSRMESELLAAVKSKYPSAKKSKVRGIRVARRPYVKGFDIDIFVPELNKGVEFDGTYYHSVEGLRRGYPGWPLGALKNYHTIKDNYFKSKGVDIVHVKEEDWIQDKEKCLRVIFDFLGK